jgi:hypothetical protein
MADRSPLHLRRIAGTGAVETLIAGTVSLPQPAVAIQELHKTVLIDQTDVTLGHVLLQGRLRTRLVYPVAPTEPAAAPSLPGAVAGLSGPLWSTTADIPFTLAIAVAGAEPAMDCRVTDAFVTADASQAAVAVDGRGYITAVLDRSLVRLGVQVLTDGVMLPAGRPARRSAPRGGVPDQAPAPPAGPRVAPPGAPSGPNPQGQVAIGRFPPPKPKR